jgi:glycosyltransferase involved in cell wall biosynthesis
MTDVQQRNPLVTSVSAFFPCYNDSMSIGKLVRDVRESLVEAVDDFEIIVVNDGSSDNSLEVLHYQRQPHELDAF